MYISNMVVVVVVAIVLPHEAMPAVRSSHAVVLYHVDVLNVSLFALSGDLLQDQLSG